MGGPQIRWTQEEITKLVTYAKPYILNGMTQVKAITGAQVLLKPDRVKSPAAIYTMLRDKRVNSALRNELHRVLSDASPILSKAPDQITAERNATAAEAWLNSSKLPASPVQGLDAILQPLVNNFRDAFRTMFEIMLVDEVSRATDMVTQLITEQAAVLHTKVTSQLKLPRILVLGPRPEQATILRKEFEGVLNLVFIDTDLNPAQAARAAKFVTGVVIWKEFMSHAVEHAVKAVATGPVKLVSGGMTSLHNELMSFI